MNDQEKQEDYLSRVKLAAPEVNEVLMKHHLNLSAQFDASSWPRAIRAVPIYVDVKDYDSAPEAESPPQPVESPIQQEDLKNPES